MIPLSFQGFGFTAILIMVAILSLNHLLGYLKERNGEKRKVKVDS